VLINEVNGYVNQPDMSVREFYTFDVNAIIQIVKERRARKVLLQLPNGLKQFATEILNELSSRLVSDVELVIDANNIFGPCLLNLSTTSNYDLVLHLGHEPYPYWRAPDNVVFLDLLSTLTPSNDLLTDLVEKLKGRDIRSVAIYTTHQHKNVWEVVASKLKDCGFNVVNDLGDRVIMGCWFGNAYKYVTIADAYIVIASGKFHPLGVGLLTNGKKYIVQLDLYRNEVAFLDDMVSKYLRIRYGKIMQALDSKTWYLIHGVEGQYRGWVRDRLIKLLKKRQVSYYELQASIINYDTLRNVDSSYVDAYVVTACPRLPIDDLLNFEKPVLTPGEALMILNGSIESYVFPW